MFRDIYGEFIIDGGVEDSGYTGKSNKPEPTSAELTEKEVQRKKDRHAYVRALAMERLNSGVADLRMYWIIQARKWQYPHYDTTVVVDGKRVYINHVGLMSYPEHDYRQGIGDLPDDDPGIPIHDYIKTILVQYQAG